VSFVEKPRLADVIGPDRGAGCVAVLEDLRAVADGHDVGGTSRLTTAPAPTTVLSPIVAPGQITTPPLTIVMRLAARTALVAT